MPIRPHVEHDKPILLTLQQLTGIKWQFYWGDKIALRLEGCYQLMPSNSLDENDFWYHHIEHDRNWFDSKPEAALSRMPTPSRSSLTI